MTLRNRIDTLDGEQAKALLAEIAKTDGEAVAVLELLDKKSKK